MEKLQSLCVLGLFMASSVFANRHIEHRYNNAAVNSWAWSELSTAALVSGAALLGKASADKTLGLYSDISNHWTIKYPSKAKNFLWNIFLGEEKTIIPGWMKEDKTYQISGAVLTALPVFILLAKRTPIAFYVKAKNKVSKVGQFCFIAEKYTDLYSLKKAINNCAGISRYGLDDFVSAGDNQDAKIIDVMELIEKDLNEAQRLLLLTKKTWILPTVISSPLFSIAKSLFGEIGPLLNLIERYRANLQAAKRVILAQPSYYAQKEDYQKDMQVQAQQDAAAAEQTKANAQKSLSRLAWLRTLGQLVNYVIIKPLSLLERKN